MTSITNVNGYKPSTLKNKLTIFGSSLMLPISVVAFSMFLLGITNLFVYIPGPNVLNTIFSQTSYLVVSNISLLFALSIANTYSKNRMTAISAVLIIYLVSLVNQNLFITPNEDGTYNALMWTNLYSSYFTTSGGLMSFNTSIFGGIMIGLMGAHVSNKTQSHSAWNEYFIVSLKSVWYGLLYAYALLFVWPLFGISVEWFGVLILSFPAGLDVFLYGTLNRLLIPFGLHSALIPIFTLSPVTGVLVQDGIVIATGDYAIWHAANNLHIPFDLIREGGSFTWEGHEYWVTENINPGQYTQGFYPIMIFAFPAAGLALTLKSDDKKRWSKIFLISLMPMLSGVTEIFEFTFIFISPVFYFFHAFMTGLSFMIMDIMNISIGMSTGFVFDIALFGIVPTVQGNPTGVAWLPVIGAGFALAYFLMFYYYNPKGDKAVI